MTKNLGTYLRQKYSFRSDTLDIIIGGKSSIDSQHGFLVQNLDEADRFIRSYGYDLENPIEKAEILGNFHEALNFIRKNFIAPDNPDGLKLEVPRKILELTDVRELFLMVSLNLPGQTADTQGQILQNWACSILKVMHTIAHIDKDVRSAHFSDIQKQIFDRFYKLIHRESEDQLFLGEKIEDPFKIKLVAFETKPKKSRYSMILKLLHKPENVAEDIFDRVGIRIITPTRLSALLVVKYLKDKMIIMPPNIKPSRSRNTLVNIEHFRSRLTEVLAKTDYNENKTPYEMSEDQFIQELEQATSPSQINPDNPHSSEYYRAIQFTCRQLIKLKNPLYEDLKELKTSARSISIPEDLLKTIDRIDLKHIQREIRFFYPYEVQVMDQHSAEENEKGRSAHSEYKKAQVQTALKRVMGSLVDASR